LLLFHQFILNQHSPYLLDLIWFRHRAPRLKVENLVNAFSGENMVAAFDPLRETKAAEERAEVVESDAGIRRAPE